MVLSKYAVTQHYGGPEEGGWWYYRHAHVGTLATGTQEQMEHLREGLLRYSNSLKVADEYANAGRLASMPDDEPISGFALDAGEELIIEEFEKEYDDSDQPRPYYE